MSRKSKAAVVPIFVTPMAALVVTTLPDNDDWLYELKLDGYRALLIKRGKSLEIRSRNDNDLTPTYPTIAEAALQLQADQAVIDGEIVALDGEGRPSFQALQHRGGNMRHEIVFYAFDALHVNGRDLTGEPLTERRKALAGLVKNSGLRLLPALPGSATDVARAVRELGLEGIVAKRKDSVYQAGERNGNWVKLKLDRQQEFVVGGYRPDSQSVDALLVGYYDGKGLRFAGKVRAGFVAHTRREVFQALKPLHAAKCPFIDLPHVAKSRWGGGIIAAEMKEMQWVFPRLVAQIRFVQWTDDGRLRHSAFLGLRTDKPVLTVRREP